MKNLFSLILCFVLVSIYTLAFGAGSSSSVAEDGDKIYHNSRTGSVVRAVTINFVADDTDGSIPDLTLNNNTTWVTHGSFEGWHLWEVSIDCLSGVTPTEDSDIYVYQDAIDLLDGNGVDKVDNTAKAQAYPGIDSSGPYPRPVTDDIVLTITQAATATNSATGSIKLVFK